MRLWQDRIQRLDKAALTGIEPEFRMAAIRRVLFLRLEPSLLGAQRQGRNVWHHDYERLAFKLPGRCGDSPIIELVATPIRMWDCGRDWQRRREHQSAGAHTIVETCGMECRRLTLA